MLSVLRLSNLAIIKELELEFTKGLNVITGETGSGKSMILKAISLLSGSRAQSDIVRYGENKAEVEGLFTLDDRLYKKICEVWEEGEGLLKGEDELIIRRVIDKNSRGRTSINGRIITLSMLQKISSVLFDITGQHDGHSLFSPVEHRKLLDSYAVESGLLKEVRDKFRKWQDADFRLGKFLEEKSSRDEYFRALEDKVLELEKASLVTGEREELEEELNKFLNVETLLEIANEGLVAIEDDNSGLEVMLARLNSSLEKGLRLDPLLKESYELINSSYEQVKEARYTLSDYSSTLEISPSRLDFLRERIALIAKLERKYKMSNDELVEYLSKISIELSEFKGGRFDKEALEREELKAREELKEVEERLSKARIFGAKKLEKLLEKELKRLQMKRATFEVRVKRDKSSLFGADLVEFYLSSNLGEPKKPLSKVASGGELSRVLLVLKALLNEKFIHELQIFDEIDSGVGGAVAEVVGEKLREVSKFSQVILVTHSAQVAALGDSHKVVAKKTKDDSTIVEINDLTHEGRVNEVARMLAGKKVSENFKESARELLQ